MIKTLALAARPKTFPASLAPVLLGGKLAASENTFSLEIFSLTLLFSLLIQIGTNYANDYFDFMKGVDTCERVGPKRAVQQGWIAPKTMWRASLWVFGSAFLIALPLMYRAGLWSFPLALLCILLGIFYTGGPHPLGYLGCGEPLVFLFFGPVALVGTYFLQTQTLSWTALLASLPVGLLSSAILTANNLRDFKTDRAAGKNTLVVRFGLPFGKWLYTLSLFSAALLSLFFSPWLPLLFLLAPFKELTHSQFLPLLPRTSFLLVLYTFTALIL